MNFRATTAVFACLFAAGVHAEDTKGLDSDKQKFSYTVGYQIGGGLRRDGVDVDPEAVTQGIRDVLSGAAPQLSTQQMQAAITAYRQKEEADRAASAEQNRKAGAAFLAENKQKQGVIELPSGLQYQVIKKGDGKQPKGSDTVTVHYRGSLINGTEFDSSYSRNEPTSFQLDGIIKGWQEALPLMHEGAKWKIFVPPALAYGEQGAGAAIGPNATLIFEIELVAIK